MNRSLISNCTYVFNTYSSVTVWHIKLDLRCHHIQRLTMAISFLWKYEYYYYHY